MSIILIVHAFFIEDHINNKNIVVIGIVDVIFSLLITLKVSFIFKFTNFPKFFLTLKVYNVFLKEIATVGWILNLVRKEFASYASNMAATGTFLVLS